MTPKKTTSQSKKTTSQSTASPPKPSPPTPPSSPPSFEKKKEKKTTATHPQLPLQWVPRSPDYYNTPPLPTPLPTTLKPTSAPDPPNPGPTPLPNATPLPNLIDQARRDRLDQKRKQKFRLLAKRNPDTPPTPTPSTTTLPANPPPPDTPAPSSSQETAARPLAEDFANSPYLSPSLAPPPKNGEAPANNFVNFPHTYGKCPRLPDCPSHKDEFESFCKTLHPLRTTMY